MEHKIGIITDCICDLPPHYLKMQGVGVIYFLIETDTGVFTDTAEITSDNIFSYMESGGKKLVTHSPAISSVREIFTRFLAEYERFIYIATSSKISGSYALGKQVAEELGEDGKRILVFDSLQISTGLGHIVMEAVDLAGEGRSAEEILEYIGELRGRVSATYLICNPEYLYLNGRIDKHTYKLFKLVKAHPVIHIKDGYIRVKGLFHGNFDRSAKRYVNKELRKSQHISTKRMFITCSGCRVDGINYTKQDVNRLCKYDELIIVKASATVSSNCGKDSFGLIFVNKR